MFFTPEMLDKEAYLSWIPSRQELHEKAVESQKEESRQLMEKYGSWIELQTGSLLQKGDWIHLKQESSALLPEGRAFKRFAKKEIQLELGAGRFSPQLEQELFKHSVSESFTLQFEHEGQRITLSLQILAAKRLKPELEEQAYQKDLTENPDTDLSKPQEGQSWVESRIQSLEDQLASEFFIQKALMKLSNQLADLSALSPSEEQLEEQMKALQLNIEAAQEEGQSLLEYYQMLFGPSVSDLETGKAKMEEYMLHYTKLCLYAETLAEREGKRPSLTEYESLVHEYAEDQKESPEAIRALVSYQDFVRGRSQEFLSKQLIRQFLKHYHSNK